MIKQIKKTIVILFIICFALSITVAAKSAMVENPKNNNVHVECRCPGNPNCNVVPVDSVYRGKTYEQWSEKWWQWALSIPAPINPLLDENGRNNSIGQSGSVWFLAGTINQTGIVRKVKIPAGKAIFFPISNVVYYAETPEDTYENMSAVTKAIIDDVTVKEVTVDGTPLKNLNNFRVGSDLFVVRTPKNFLYNFTLPPGRYPAVSDGYWIMLKPLSKGVHTIRIHSRVDSDIIGINEVGVKYIITVT